MNSACKLPEQRPTPHRPHTHYTYQLMAVVWSSLTRPFGRANVLYGRRSPKYLVTGSHSILWITGDPYSRPEAAMVVCGWSPQVFLSHISHQRPGEWSHYLWHKRTRLSRIEIFHARKTRNLVVVVVVGCWWGIHLKSKWKISQGWVRIYGSGVKKSARWLYFRPIVRWN